MGKTVERKRKKKGRPSLLDLQKRSLRLQEQQQKRNPNPNPNPNPYLRFPNTGAGTGRRSARRNPIIETVSDLHADGEEDEGNIGKRREKKLKLVLRIDDHSENSPRHSGPSGTESEEEGSGSRRKRKIEAFDGGGDRLKVDRHSSLKTTELLRADTSNLGPATTLPDKKLLLFILDMLQKKDTYGVFSEPVDPEELPDYHEVIKHPMDFSTVRKKLSSGAYKNLEQFEKDVFLISSNAMRYNATDTIYYRQARSIQELAKKNFENLRQESDKEPESKTVVRRGRPPSKNINRSVGLLPSEFTSSGFSTDSTPNNAGGAANLSNQSQPLLKKGLATDKPGLTDISGKVLYGLRNSDPFGWMNTNKVDTSEEFPGSEKGITTRLGKKAPVMEENRRTTYSQFQQYNYGCELPIWSLFDDWTSGICSIRQELGSVCGASWLHRLGYCFEENRKGFTSRNKIWPRMGWGRRNPSKISNTKPVFPSL
ncbi:bromodomain-containing protein 9-like isoform X2 [Phalaenopsis equestris]|uniref:bromodomain-containing protein 9-like isoform X2 n=1 Tax=Phalaenopsis equestris TaxID=78828 RepID=UPI0009E6381C|nr:bromodomain-containing protein 9-like isoform X2 [Phalaenopsis equestris]